ncbi:MAG: PIN domain-containing protein [Nannocystaceae bacterium]
MEPRAVLIFDTNILVDIWLARDGNESVLLLQLAEEGIVDLVLPEYVLIEFRGFALRWLRDERAKLEQRVRTLAREWGRSDDLDEGADLIAAGCRKVDEGLEGLRNTIDQVAKRVRAVARVKPHTPEIHFRGDLRFLSGRPPDRPIGGIKDCRIFEAILEIAAEQERGERLKYVVTKDQDFDHEELRLQLDAQGFSIRKDPGRLFGELRPRPD